MACNSLMKFGSVNQNFLRKILVPPIWKSVVAAYTQTAITQSHLKFTDHVSRGKSLVLPFFQLSDMVSNLHFDTP